MKRFGQNPLGMHPFDDDKLHEECGVFAIYGHPDAGAHTALGLHALQHRGQEAAGIVSYDTHDKQFHAHKDLGLVGDIFASADVMKRLSGSAAIGHNRYATSGGTLLRNVQPLFADLAIGSVALAHNGNITNAVQLRNDLVKSGSLFHSTSDTEVFVHLIARSQQSTILDRLIDALRQIEGAYSLVVLTEKSIIGVRDPLGIRPLVLGRLDGSYIFASETCALDIIGAEVVRDLKAGEIVVIDGDGLKSFTLPKSSKSKHCIFEYIYFARPDSIMEGKSIYEARKQIGCELARESHVMADVVIPVPDSGVPSALGYAQESGLPFELGIIRNHYVGRTFIEPAQEIRDLGVRLKHNANRAKIDGKRVILVDDSIVRGTTSRKIVSLVRAAGAKEVHMRIAAPPTTHSCFYGVDTPERTQLLASNMSVQEMNDFIGADSLHFISLDGLYRAMGEASRNSASPQFCDACFTGQYPTQLTDQDDPSDRQISLLSELKRAKA